MVKPKSKMKPLIPFPGEGAYYDCLDLIEKFEKKKSFNFMDFVDVWQEMKFSLIFTGRALWYELKEFTEELIQIAKTFTLDKNNDFYFRVGALYLLYGLYGKQVGRSPIKIRVTESEFRKLIALIYELKTAKHEDASMVMYNLFIRLHAFYLVVTPQNYGLHRSYRKYHDSNSISTVINNDASLIRQTQRATTNLDLLPSLEKLNQEYYRIKCILPSAENTEPAAHLNKVGKNFGQVFLSNFQKFQQCLEQGVPFSDEGESSKMPDKSIRKKLKEKAFSSKATAKFKIKKKFPMDRKSKPNTVIRRNVHRMEPLV